MMIRFVLIMFLAFSNNAFAYNEIWDKIEENEVNEDNKIEILASELKAILGRVELLEKQNVEMQQKIVDLSSSKSTVVIKNNNDDSQNEKELYDNALAILKDGNYSKAEEQFASFIKDFPKSNLISNSYFWYGESYYKRSNYESAALNFLKCYKNYPKSTKAPDALLKLAMSLGYMDKKQEACSMLNKLNIEYKNRSAASVKLAQDAMNKFGCK